MFFLGKIRYPSPGSLLKKNHDTVGNYKYITTMAFCNDDDDVF